MSEILVRIVGGMVTVVRGPVTVMVDTALDLVSVSRERAGGETKEPREEYTRGGDGRKIVAEPPVKPEPPFAVPEVALVPDQPLNGLRDPSLDPRAGILAEAPARKNGLVDHIEKKSGGNGGTPALGGAVTKKQPVINEERRVALIGWLKKTNTTPSVLARRINMYPTDIHKQIKGKRNISEYCLKLYAAGFGVSVEEFLAGGKEEQKEPEKSPAAADTMETGPAPIDRKPEKKTRNNIEITTCSHDRLRAFLRSLRKPNELSTDFSRRINIPLTVLSNYLYGRVRIGYLQMSRIAASIGLTPEEFLCKANDFPLPAAPEKKPDNLSGFPLSAAPSPSSPPSLSPAQKKPAGSCPRKKTEKEEPEVELEPLVAALCRTCRESGDGDCHGCRVALALRRARIQETPGVITLNARASACANCDHNGRSKCRRCRLGTFVRAQELFDGGKSVDESVSTAWGEFRAEEERK